MSISEWLVVLLFSVGLIVATFVISHALVEHAFKLLNRIWRWNRTVLTREKITGALLLTAIVLTPMFIAVVVAGIMIPVEFAPVQLERVPVWFSWALAVLIFVAFFSGTFLALLDAMSPTSEPEGQPSLRLQ